MRVGVGALAKVGPVVGVAVRGGSEVVEGDVVGEGWEGQGFEGLEGLVAEGG